MLGCDWPLQHAHIDNIKPVANLSNNKDVFMCILCFHAQAGYLQHYETLLKELLPMLHISVTCSSFVYIPVHTSMYLYILVRTGMYCIVLDILYDAQAGTIQSAGCVLLDINILKPNVVVYTIKYSSVYHYSSIYH